MFRVVIEGGPYPAPRCNLKEGETVSLGSGEQDEIRVDSDSLSENHLTLRAEGHSVHVEVRQGVPLPLANGIEKSSFELKSGDSLKLGELTLTFTFVVFALGDGRRRTSRMQHVTTLAVGIVLVLEIGFIIAFSLIKSSKPRMPSKPEPAPAAVQASEPERVSQPALFFDTVEPEVESDNQGVFDILQAEVKIGTRRTLSEKEEDSIFLEVVWERGTADQTWVEQEEYASVKKQKLNAETISSPLVSTLLIPKSGVDGLEVPAERVRATFLLSLGGQVMDQKTISFEGLDPFE